MNGIDNWFREYFFNGGVRVGSSRGGSGSREVVSVMGITAVAVGDGKIKDGTAVLTSGVEVGSKAEGAGVGNEINSGSWEVHPLIPKSRTIPIVPQ